jgi:hypothetical protein
MTVSAVELSGLTRWRDTLFNRARSLMLCPGFFVSACLLLLNFVIPISDTDQIDEQGIAIISIQAARRAGNVPPDGRITIGSEILRNGRTSIQIVVICDTEQGLNQYAAPRLTRLCE